MLEISDLRAGYGRMAVLHGLDLTAMPGRPTVVMGANGVGKTTLCRAITGLIPVWSGGIRLDGHDITCLSPAQRVRRGIALVPEGRQVFPDMTVRDNLRLGAYLRGEPGPSDLEQVEALFPILADRRRQTAGLLSGGEQQMLALARALMSRPRLLILDEPSQGLAPKAVAQVAEAVQRISESGVAILLVEQNMTLAETVGEWAVVLQGGRAEVEGPASTVLKSGAVEASYLGH
ncbi:ABC transporter ATP-binding protein [Paracoccus laeviglucosivorans]|uniref:Amino acid/amide ABC transporter ATP-binding protein 2, HAAT family n=1 Tax=Paracoccus laeviglucosivorans TaxID=1197861 RepID=A0A521FBS4_9RHOB|nr:ABC transporter ATP-binding protein [Paracoccus laeviglucosivorans]SMO93524.1 amino acid/amide ABC transporter ATP-binding protein 2, HAAT family [Paracoccus laeviglucosivorans]